MKRASTLRLIFLREAKIVWGVTQLENSLPEYILEITFISSFMSVDSFYSLLKPFWQSFEGNKLLLPTFINASSLVLLVEVAVLYSGGKDSTYALEKCLQKKWKVKYLLSVKPTRNDCYLFHFSTVEHTRELAQILGFKHLYTVCDVADPKLEAQIIRDIVAQNPVDALVLGGVGLQETQLKSIRDAVFDLGVEVFASHAGEDHEQLVREMIEKGYDIRITQVAVEGLGKEWVGKKLTKEHFAQLKKLSEHHGFHVGAEGGHYDTLVVDGPIFTKRFEITDSAVIMEDAYCGYLKVHRFTLVDKSPLLRNVY